MRLVMHLAALAVLSGGSMMAGTLQYQVQVNTLAFGTVTELDFELVPRNGVPKAVEATISDFKFQSVLTSSEGAYLGTPTGSISSTLTLSNEGSGEGYYRGYSTPSTFQFLLTFTGAGVGSGASGNAETVFRLFLLNSSQLAVTGDAFMEIIVAGNGGASVWANRFTTVTPVNAAVPEPTSWLMMGSALVLIARRIRA